ncbi:MAG TPA: spore germination protein GerW family protein [Clostridia bacterium]|nr:spore germination protein GerW family protein [Clostridia bacterium]
MESIGSLMDSTLTQLKSVIDVDNIIGKPIIADDMTTVIPISKVSFGFVMAGGEYNESSPKIKISEYPYANASGGGVTITPLGFLVCGREKKFIAVDGKNEGESKWLNLTKSVLEVLKKDKEED